MSYTPKTWATGDTIEAEDMNKIENGIAAASGGMVVEILQDVDDGPYLNKTFTEIYTALKNKVPCYLYFQSSSAGTVDEDIDDNYHVSQRFAPIIGAYKYDNKYRVMAQFSNMVGLSEFANHVGEPAAITFGTTNIDGRLLLLAMVTTTYQSLTYTTYLPV